MAKKKQTSTHRHGTKLVEVERDWHQIHLDAGYHEQEWGEHSNPKHRHLGDHDLPAGRLTVTHVAEHPVIGGPTFRIDLPDGSSVDVLCADTVQAYLELHGASAAEDGVSHGDH